jgi:N-acetylglucosamine-6-phosphate deacetylase
MNDGDIVARHISTGRVVRLRWQDGRIRDLQDLSTTQSSEWWLAPTLLDLQVNGYAGVDFQQDNLSDEALAAATAGLARDGCTRWMLTLITDDWPRLLARLAHLRRLRERSAILRQAIVGWHLEGPFLSAEPGYRGAHEPSVMIDPSPAHLSELRRVAGPDLLLLTLAPERTGALEAIATATSMGCIVSLGHTNATAVQLRDATMAGARAFTHLGNACPQLIDRHDNILWRVLETPGLSVSLIPDGIHVSESLFRLVHRLLPSERITYITDAMAAAGAGPGRYPLGRLQLEVGPDQVVRLPGHAQFAGSAVRPIDAIRRAAAMLNQPWQQGWARYSTNPAALVNLPQALLPGEPAEFCLVREDDGGAIREVRTCWQGVVHARVF